MKTFQLLVTAPFFPYFRQSIHKWSNDKKITFFSLLLGIGNPFCSQGQIKLEQRSLLNGKIELLVPDYFKPMTATVMAEKYPNPGQKPDLVLTDENAEVNIVITHTHQPIQKEQIGQYKDFMISSLKKLHPDAEWQDNGVKIINGKKLATLNLYLPR